MAEISPNAGGMERLLKELIRQVVQEENAKLFVKFQAELDRREQYGTARAILTDVLPPEADEITAPVAARILGQSSSNTLLKQMERGDTDLAACMLPGKDKGKARRFSRTMIKALKARRG